MKLLKINYSVLEKYRRIEGNEKSTFMTARKKLTRNIKLADKLKETDLSIIYKYGNLLIKVNKAKNTIVKLHTIIQHDSWEKNEFLKYMYDKELEIKTS